MEKQITGWKAHWKTIVMAIWMVVVIGLLYQLNGQMAALQAANTKLASDIDSIESILLSTDSNIVDMKATIDEMSPKVQAIHQRVKRR